MNPVPSESAVVVLSSSSDDDVFQKKQPTMQPSKQPSKRARVSMFPVSIPSESEVKRILKTHNTDCIPRVRGSSKLYIRFNCKTQDCTLNVSGKVVDGLIQLNEATYKPGTCKPKPQTLVKPLRNPTEQTPQPQTLVKPLPNPTEQPPNPTEQPPQPPLTERCMQCNDLLPASSVHCSGVHSFCDECFDQMVAVQVKGTDKVSFIAGNGVIWCKYCAPHSSINIQAYSSRLTPTTWRAFLNAVTESAVIEEQRRHEAMAMAMDAKPPDELAFVADLIVSKCPGCSRMMSDDFDGCLALQCGRTVAGGAGLGCGMNLCAYCLQQCADETAVHDHLSSCIWNPRPNSMFPRHDHRQILLQVRRERVWYHVVATVYLQQQIPAIWTKIAGVYPELAITDEWLQLRNAWLEIAAEMQISFDDFAPLAPKYERCLHSVTDMGFVKQDILITRDIAMRATLLAQGDPSQAAITLLACPCSPRQ